MFLERLINFITVSIFAHCREDINATSSSHEYILLPYYWVVVDDFRSAFDRKRQQHQRQQHQRHGRQYRQAQTHIVITATAASLSFATEMVYTKTNFIKLITFWTFLLKFNFWNIIVKISSIGTENNNSNEFKMISSGFNSYSITLYTL